jgi:hypothetical protein
MIDCGKANMVEDLDFNLPWFVRASQFVISPWFFMEPGSNIAIFDAEF